MDLALSKEDRAFAERMREFFTSKIPADIRGRLARGEHPTRDDTVTSQRILNQHGLAVPHWPLEWGGQDWSPLQRHLWAEEMTLAHVPPPIVFNTAMVGPVIATFGSQALKERFLPGTANADIWWSQGFSEPNAGSDLASLKTTAVRDGDDYVVNGQKMWTSLIQYADYVWLACRTDPGAPKHKGLSMLIVPTDSPGFSWTPVRTMAGVTTSATYYEDVRVPASSVVGAVDGGWALITNQLNHERVALTSAAPILTALQEVREWAQQTKLPDGRRVIDQEWVQLSLARVHAKAQFLRLKNWQIASGSGPVGPADASATKVFGTEFATEAYRLLMEVLGPNAVVRPGSPAALLQGRVERMHRSSLILTFGGGTNEVQRDIIGAVGLRLPASGR